MTFAEFGFTIEDYVTKELKLDLERGGRYVRCPLHDEDTASFRIYDDEDTFYCFGCNVGGDVVVLHQKLAAKQGRVMKYGTAIGEVRKIVYKHTKNEKVLEEPKRRLRSDYVIDGKRVVARAITQEQTTEESDEVSAPISAKLGTKVESPVTEEEKSGGNVAPPKALSPRKEQRSALETLHLVQETRRSIWNRDVPNAQRLLYSLENP